MREVLVLDANVPPVDYAALLGLPPGTETVRMAGAFGHFQLKVAVDRAVFIPDFRQGGPHQYQIDLINRSSEVGSWVILALEADASIVMQYRARISDSALLFTDPEEARAALQFAVLERNTCLIVSMHPSAPLAAVEAMLRQDLGYWNVSSAAMGPSRSAAEALAAFPASRAVLVGTAPMDFDGVVWPANIKPYFVIAVQGETADGPRRRRMLRQMKAYVPDALESHVFFVNTAYEQWRRDVASGTRDPLSLKTETLFCMLDRFGLPQAPETYLDDEAVLAYLAQFTDIQDLADSLKH